MQSLIRAVSVVGTFFGMFGVCLGLGTFVIGTISNREVPMDRGALVFFCGLVLTLIAGVAWAAVELVRKSENEDIGTL